MFSGTSNFYVDSRPACAYVSACILVRMPMPIPMRMRACVRDRRARGRVYGHRIRFSDRFPLRRGTPVLAADKLRPRQKALRYPKTEVTHDRVVFVLRASVWVGVACVCL